MLRSLHIENVAVIRSADLELDTGFSVLTGETGAGKSMIIDSINLLLGNRVSREMIRTGEHAATVSAVFEELCPSVREAVEELGFSCEDGCLLLQRTLYADGKSQTRLNGRIITQAMQREITRLLVSIHGQSDSQKLLQKSTHAELLDAYAHPDVLLDAYRESFRALKETRKQIDAVRCDESERLRRREMLAYQIADIEALKLKDGEEEALERELDRLSNLERINQHAELAWRALRGGEKTSALSLIRRAEHALEGLFGLVDGAQTLAERLSSVAAEIDDVAELAISMTDDDREDPTARIDRIQERLEAISKLKRKYGASIGAILAFCNKAKDELEMLDTSEERLAALEKEEKLQLAKARSLADRLTACRRDAAKRIQCEVTEALSFLDMPRVRFEVSVIPAELGERGADDVEFLIATNAGEPLLPMIKIASGGELSRIMLALRSVLNDRDGATTVIFDEIDTGVSGKTSRKIGIKLLESARGAQVLCVTHSAQIASLADQHYLISKAEQNGRTETSVSLLDDSARVEEIARILGGIEITEAQRDAAREMIGEYRDKR